MKEHLTRVTRKGQITVPVAVRRALGLAEGDAVAVMIEGNQARLERRLSFAERTAGILKSSRPPLTLEQEREEFEQGVAGEVMRSMER